MKSASRALSVIAGIIATIIGAISVIGMVITFVELKGFDSAFIKPMVICILFFVAGISLLCKGGNVSKLIGFILMLAVTIIELWVSSLAGSVFTFTEMAFAFIFKSADLIITFAKIYEVIIYIIMVCSFLAMVFHIIGWALSKK